MKDKAPRNKGSALAVKSQEEGSKETKGTIFYPIQFNILSNSFILISFHFYIFYISFHFY